MPMHEDELAIDDELVRALVARDAPAFADRPIRRSDTSGSSNALFRLGDDLLVRLPRQSGGSATILKEARWLPAVASALRVAVPEVVTVGEPGFGYPERWSLTRWIDGRPPGVPDAGSDGLAHDLADVVSALRGLPVPPDAGRDAQLRWYRGEPLAALDATTRQYLAQCRGLAALNLALDACSRVWDAAMELPGVEAAGSPYWYHGDLLAENLLVRDGRLTAVLDFGGLGVGDPTVDLVAAWQLLEPAQRAVFRADLQVDEATWLRGRAWALALAVMTFPYYWDSLPARCAAQLRTARAVLADAAG